MIGAQKEHLKNFLQGTGEYIVPFFQRAYVWDRENWDELWENIVAISIPQPEDQPSEHFIGTLIVKQRPATKIGENEYEIIDGQQRLTTICLLLKAVADTVEDRSSRLIGDILGLVKFTDNHGETHFRIRHNRVDRPSFEAVLAQPGTLELESGAKNRIQEAYCYFVERCKTINDVKREQIVLAVLDRVPVISMLLGKSDDEQVIFDTINALGVKLTTGELLKNYVFKNESVLSMYETHWLPVFEKDDEQVGFWNKNKTAGRIIRTNIEVLLYCYLILKSKREVRIEKLYAEYKSWLHDVTEQELANFLDELRSLAEIYFALPTGQDLTQIRFEDHERRLFFILDGLNVTTAYPLILFIYANFEGEERLTQLRVLESYIVRRNIVRLTTKNYNNVFLSLVQKMSSQRDGDTLHSKSLERLLHEFDDDSSRFPLDPEVLKAFKAVTLTNQNARVLLSCIAIHSVASPLSDVTTLNPYAYSIEHVMPREWRHHWNDEDLDPIKQLERDAAIKTLGNLTLITKRLNSKLKNAPWSQKKGVLQQFSVLPMTTAYLTNDHWNEALIEQRGSDLSKQAIGIWVESLC